MSVSSHNFVGLYFRNYGTYRQSEKIVKQQYLPTCLYNIVNFGLLAAETVSLVWGTRANLTCFASWLRCSDVAHRRPTGLCTMYGRLQGCYIIYTFPGALAPWRNFATCKIHFTSKSCVVLYWQSYWTALKQRVSAKLYGVVQGMELPNFRRGPGATYIRLGGHHVGHRPTF